MLIDLTPAQVNIIKQALRSEEGRLKEAGYRALSECASEALSAIRNAELDKALPIV
jgi:hypothetical protein